MPTHNRTWAVLSLIVLLTVCPTWAAAAELGGRYEPSVEILKTDDGVRFGRWGSKPAAPAPTLLVLATTIEQTLGDAAYRQAANYLLAQGYQVVSLDLPCHGAEHGSGEPDGLAGWRARLDRGEPFIEPFVTRAGKLLDYLVRSGTADPQRIAVAGTSRGAFAALHLAARDNRVTCAIGLSPVTELEALREFARADASAMKKLSLRAFADKLAEKHIWLLIRDDDPRVDTASAIELDLAVSKAAHDRHQDSRIELHLSGGPALHTTPTSAAEDAARWLARRFETAEFEPLFDGSTLRGWEGNTDVFRVEQGAIVAGSLSAPVKRNEFLCTLAEYEDFELRLKFKVQGDGVNAGVQFRTKRIANHWEVSGYQADVGQQYWGSLYDESRRKKILAQPAADRVAKVIRNDDWNDYVIRCRGPRIQLWLNGLETVDYTETTPGIGRSGIIAVQIHGGPPSEARYKDIRIRRLD